jgi:DNA sulfur modification protein DndD
MVFNLAEAVHFRGLISKVTMKFYEETTISPHIVVSLGKNGVGKTTVINLIRAGLCGLEEDADFYYTTIDSLNEDGTAVESAVTVGFRHKNTQYKVERVFSARINSANCKLIQNEKKATLYISRPGCDTEIIDDKRAVDNYINSIVPANILSYVLFNGEEISSSFCFHSAKDKLNTNKAVDNVLGIEQCSKVLYCIGKFKAKQSTVLGQENNRLKEILDKQSQIETDIRAVGEENLMMTEEINKNRIARATYQQKINDAAELQDKKSRGKELEAEIYNVTIQKRDYCNTLKSCMKNSHVITSALNKQKVVEMLNREKSELVDTELDLDISTEAYQESLRLGKCCLCLKEFDKNSDTESYMSSVIDRRLESENWDYFLEITAIGKDLASDIKYADSERDKVVNILKKLQELDSALLPLENELKELDEAIKTRIGAMRDSEIFEWQKAVNNLDEKITADEYKIKQNNIRIDGLKTDLLECIKQRDELSKKESINKVNEKILKAFERLENSYQSSFEEVKKAAREEIESEVQKYFKTILRNQKDLTRFAKVEITNEFKIRVLSSNNIDTTHELSRAQQQMLLIVLIAIVNKVSADGTNNETMPILLDTGFARLDTDYRKSIMEILSGILTQIIILAINDEEYTEKVHGDIVNTGKLHKIIEMTKDEQGNVSLNEIMQPHADYYFINRIAN